MCKTFQSAGFRVLWANNGADALALCRDAEPPVDLLVTDYTMPGMTGLELASECCSLNDELAVLYISGSWPGDDLRADLTAKRSAFLAKPFRQAELLRGARAVLATESAAASPRVNRAAAFERFSMEMQS
jgi:CheY-like chemotaxis protein